MHSAAVRRPAKQESAPGTFVLAFIAARNESVAVQLL